MVNKFGCFVISLDFELFWGVRDRRTINDYGDNILGAREVIPEMVNLFSKYNVKATFATVGLLYCKNKEEINQYTPVLKPTYNNSFLSPFENNYLDSVDDNNDIYHSAFDIIEGLKQENHIEIASHTFSHFYCWEAGQNLKQFESDVESSIHVFSSNHITLKSIVFPRNQVPDHYLNTCIRYGINTYRGNPIKYFNKGNKTKNRLLRLIDTFINFGNDTTYTYNEVKEGKFYNVRASRYLRPFSQKYKFLAKLKIRRIKNEMNVAAKQNKIYHLWWHPHNFGINKCENLSMLEEILFHFQYLSIKYNFKSFTMKEMSGLVNYK